MMQTLVIPANRQRTSISFSSLHKCIIHGIPFHSSHLGLIYLSYSSNPADCSYFRKTVQNQTSSSKLHLTENLNKQN